MYIRNVFNIKDVVGSGQNGRVGPSRDSLVNPILTVIKMYMSVSFLQGEIMSPLQGHVHSGWRTS